MPTHIDGEIRRVNQSEFGRISYPVMEQAFAVQNELGRLFNEDVYRDALASRLANARTEVQVDVCFEDFRKSYFLDLVVEDAALFEEDVSKPESRPFVVAEFAGIPTVLAIRLNSCEFSYGFETSSRRFLSHTDLEGTHWINITRNCITFKSLHNESKC